MDFIEHALSNLGIWDWILATLQTDVAKMTVAFTIAAHMHRRWVKKDVSDQFLKITTAIDNVAATISRDLDAHRARIDRLESGIVNIDSRVQRLETKPKE